MTEGPTLIDVVFTAPVIGVRKREPLKLHALTLRAVASAWPNGKPKRLPVAACGVSGVRILSDGPHSVLPWPPPARGAVGFERCRECWVATGKKRPRSHFAQRGEEDPE